MFQFNLLLMLTLGINALFSQEQFPDSTASDSTREAIVIPQIGKPDFQHLIQNAVSDSQFIIIYWDSSRNEVFIHQMPANNYFWSGASKIDTLTKSNLHRNQHTEANQSRDPWNEIIEQIFEGKINKLRVMQGEQEERLLQELSGEEINYLLSLEGAGSRFELLENLGNNQGIQIIKIEANQPIFIIKSGETTQR